MNGKPSLQDLLEVSKHFGLPSPALVEKDWYVVKALAAITAAHIAPFRLAFGGGTALSRAHRLIYRMSEDLDLKIIANEKTPRSAFRNLREVITKALLGAGFVFDPENPAQCESGNASRYTLYRLPYEPITRGEGALRPEIQIEMAAWPVRRPTTERSVISFIAEALNNPPEIPSIACVSVTETVAEKFVALTRRAGAELAGAGGPRDPTLVRHVYDLHLIRDHFDPAEVAALARTIIEADVKTYGHQFPAYRENPIREIRRAVAGLLSDPEYARRFANFHRDMVYGDQLEFIDAMATISDLADRLDK